MLTLIVAFVSLLALIIIIDIPQIVLVFHLVKIRDSLCIMILVLNSVLILTMQMLMEFVLIHVLPIHLAKIPPLNV